MAPISHSDKGKGQVVTSHNARRLVVVGGILLAALAACGSEPPGTQLPAGGPVSPRDLPGGGTVRVGTAGKTLYFTDSDTGGAIKCTGECTKLWVPVAAAG